MTASGSASGGEPLLAPAKLNLGLRVVGRRPDGYHLLDSLFVPLDWCDVLRLSVEPGAGEPEVALRIGGGPPELARLEENLAARAALGFLRAAGLKARVTIELEKRIPLGAGLGGGSSDAGTILRALAATFAEAVPPAALAGLAVGLGADVPFFLDPRPARVTGIGEEIVPLAGVPAFDVVVATPAPPLETARVFRAFAASRSGRALTPAEAGRRMPWLPAEDRDPVDFGTGRAPEALRALEDLQTLLANDLEPVATRLHPAIGRLRAALTRAGARAVGMSGSGPTVFGVFGSGDEARTAAARIRWEPTDRVHVGRTAASP